MEKMILAEMPLASSCDTETLDFDTLVYTHGRFVLNIAYSVLGIQKMQKTLYRKPFSGLSVPAIWVRLLTSVHGLAASPGVLH